mmetsp:Transcript_15403/g.33278  ORF Transcript_15403/g.33278 Transcript_15403/m.33278 type:complete len:213 (-) Transcript_15403:2205-2843(-)
MKLSAFFTLSPLPPRLAYASMQILYDMLFGDKPFSSMLRRRPSAFLAPSLSPLLPWTFIITWYDISLIDSFLESRNSFISWNRSSARLIQVGSLSFDIACNTELYEHSSGVIPDSGISLINFSALSAAPSVSLFAQLSSTILNVCETGWIFSSRMFFIFSRSISARSAGIGAPEAMPSTFIPLQLAHPDTAELNMILSGLTFAFPQEYIAMA